MRLSTIAAIAMVAVVAVVLGPDALADSGENAAAVKDAVANGVNAAAPAAFSGNWLGAAFGFLAGAVPGLLAVLSHQAQSKWHMFHAQNAIDAARAPAAPAVTVTDQK